MSKMYAKPYAINNNRTGAPSPLKQKGEKGSDISVMQCVDNSLKHDNI